jgi:hypothetical protein
MSARVILFPAARRVGFLRRQVAGVAHHNRRETKVNAIDAVLRRQYEALSKIAGDEAALDHVEELARLLAARLRTSCGKGGGIGGAA